MADSTDTLLARAREAWHDYVDTAPHPAPSTAALLALNFHELDVLLSSGGPLPAAWAACEPARPVTDVPLPVRVPGSAMLAECGAEIARLTAELDAARNVPVEYVITAGLEAAMAVDPHREDGTVLRVTDGAKRAFAWKAATREWEQIR